VSRCGRLATTRAQRASAAGDRETLCAALEREYTRAVCTPLCFRLLGVTSGPAHAPDAPTQLPDPPHTPRLPLVASCARPAAA